MIALNNFFDVINRFTIEYGIEGSIGVGAAILICIWCISLGYKK